MTDETRVPIAGGHVDLRGRRGVLHGQEFTLTSREAALLTFLTARTGQPVSTETLLVEVWDYAPGVVSRAVHNTVNRLRNKIEQSPATPAHLLTEHGVGFCWAPAPAARIDPATPPAAEEASALPVVSGRFIGRAAQMDAVLALLATRAPLVTLTGVGGVGKTRLVSEVARRLVGEVRFVALESARTAPDVLRCVARVLGVRLGKEPRKAVTDALHRLGPATLILDNCEQVLAPVAELAGDWLRPEMCLLATSRAPLGRPEEHVVEVPPLQTVETGPEASGISEAAGLLQARVALVAPLVASQTALSQFEAVAAVLAGLPLALELAAPWLASVGVAVVLAGLECAPIALGSGAGRHESLEACLAWGWGCCRRPIGPLRRG